MLKPKYAENIIVSIIINGKFHWYITEKDVWILDINKYADDFVKNGYKFDIQFALKFRGDIAIIEKENALTFLELYKENATSSYQLKEMLQNREYEDTVLSMRPSLYINFDKEELYSLYPEYLAYERYVPDGWKGEYYDFMGLIPQDEKYWLNGDKNLLKEIFEQERGN